MEQVAYPKHPTIFLVMLDLATIEPGPKLSLSFSALHQHISQTLGFGYSKDALLHAIYTLERSGSLTLDQCPTSYQKGELLPDLIIFSSVQKGVAGLITLYDEILRVLKKIGGI